MVTKSKQDMKNKNDEVPKSVRQRWITDGTTKETLYKYRSFNENTLAIFINQELYFAKAESFNDPFDCQFNLFEGVKAFLTDIDQKEYIEDEKRMHEIKEQYVRANKEISSSGILALSEEGKNILMWSHYANKHKGICIGFDAKGLRDDFKTMIHVADYCVYYEGSQPFKTLKDLNPESEELFSYPDADANLILIQYKHKDWRYENEVRFLKPNPGPSKFTPANMKTVYYGIRTPSSKKKLLYNLIQTNNSFKHLRQYQMVRQEGEFSIMPEQLTDTYLNFDGDGKN